jgi:hypothetical protein
MFDGERRMIVVENLHVLAQPQKMLDFRRLQPCDPGVADELAVAGQRGDRLIGKRVLEDLHQVDPLGGVRVSRFVEHAPEQRHAHIIMRNAQHQNVEIGFAELPVGAIQRQVPKLAFEAERLPNQPRHFRFVSIPLH